MVAILDDILISVGALLVGVLLKALHSKIKKSKCSAQLNDIGLDFEIKTIEQQTETKTNE